MKNIQQLSSQFAIENQLSFEQHDSGFVMLVINNDHAQAKVSLYGAHVLAFKPHDQDEDLFFCSNKAIFNDGIAIRAGIPICWPWFGADKSGRDLAAHGFARNINWQVSATESLADGSTKIVLELNDTEDSRAVWPHAFNLQLELVIGQNLDIKLTTHNTGDSEFTISQALHSYFNASDIEKIEVVGLSGVHYLDKLRDFASFQQSGEITISQEVDRVYIDAPKQLIVKDAGFDRTLTITNSGSQTAVVWNPWIESSQGMADMQDNGYRRFICVETANTANDCITLSAGESHSTATRYSLT